MSFLDIDNRRAIIDRRAIADRLATLKPGKRLTGEATRSFAARSNMAARKSQGV